MAEAPQWARMKWLRDLEAHARQPQTEDDAWSLAALGRRTGVNIEDILARSREQQRARDAYQPFAKQLTMGAIDFLKSAYQGARTLGEMGAGVRPMEGPDGRISDEAIKAAFDVAGLTALGTTAAPRGVLASGVSRPPRRPPLPMDEPSRMARARQLGYEEEPFWRGEAPLNRRKTESKTELPNKYETGGYFARDKSYADDFARVGGHEEAREFRLNLQNAFKTYEDLTAAQFARLVAAARDLGDHRLAQGLTDLVAPGRSVDWMIGFAKKLPDEPVTRGGSGIVAGPILGTGRFPKHTFREAGFDAIDDGANVRKLSGHGIRLSTAEFDPAKRTYTDINRALGGLAVLPPAAAFVASPDDY